MKKNKKIHGSKTILFVLIFCIKLITYDAVVYCQSIARDNGHGCINGHTIFADWNFEAGKNMPVNYTEYPEFLPLIKGWDFRINLPHVRFQLTTTGETSAPAMVGVIEGRPDDRANNCDPNPQLLDGTMNIYGHINNSIWLFEVFKQDSRIHYKVLPSRRDLNSSKVENITSLTNEWIPIGTGQTPRFKIEKPAVAVVGEGIGIATIYIVARDENNLLYFSKRLMTNTNTSAWTEPWVSLGITSKVPPDITSAFSNKLALAWVDVILHRSDRLKVKIYDPSTNEWGQPFQFQDLPPEIRPQLLWDGKALNLFALLGYLKHTYTISDNPLSFSSPVKVSDRSILQYGGFSVIVFNNRFHVVFSTGGSTPEDVYYTTSTTPFGQNSIWAPITNVGFKMRGEPKITTFYENIYIIGSSENGRLIYSRKDPNKPGVEITGSTSIDQWLERGTEIDKKTPGHFVEFEVLSFNTDVYLCSKKVSSVHTPQGDVLVHQGTHLINFSRAAMKYLLAEKWGMKLTLGEPGGFAIKGRETFAKSNETPLIGDFDGDKDDDIIKFDRNPEDGVGFAPVYVSLNENGKFGENQLWHKFFARPGEIPMVGDFNGDGKDDIVTFTQQKQKDASGNEIGPAVVWVALSDGTKFGQSKVWHKFFSLKGEIPMVGDFNGDGKDDIITFTQQKQKNADGTVIGPAVVWVALSDGTKFGPSRVWHTFFSLKGEIPMVGDFNGDGKDDIVTFVQHSQKFSDGSLMGHAPVWVALSDGTKFGQSKVWHTFFSLKGELPRVGDMNMDGRDDIVTFLRGNASGNKENDIYVAYSLGNKFDRSITWQNNYVSYNQLPFIGHISSKRLKIITDNPVDTAFFPDIFAFRNDGAVHVSVVMGNVPYPAGAPWERYKWFPDKALGVAQFPEWIYQQQKHCISANHNFALIGSGGSGGEFQTLSSVRFGGRAGHILQELGHSIFANCFRENRDAFEMYNSIFVKPFTQGGFGAGYIAGICTEDDRSDYYDCRKDDPVKAEHIFLDLMVKYRLNGDEFRDRIRTETNPIYKTQLKAAYQWLKQNWFKGLEFKRGVAINASLTQDGVPCLSGECQ